MGIGRELQRGRGWTTHIGRSYVSRASSTYRATGRLVLDTHAASLWHAESNAATRRITQELARAAALLAAKQTSMVLPARLATPCAHIDVWIESATSSTPAPQPALPSQESSHMPMMASPPSRTGSPSMGPQSDGGFSAASLLDPDAWLEGVASPPSSPVAVPSRSSSDVRPHEMYIHCRTTSHADTAIEAMAGCTAACISMCDAVHTATGAYPTIEQVQILP